MVTMNYFVFMLLSWRFMACISQEATNRTKRQNFVYSHRFPFSQTSNSQFPWHPASAPAAYDAEFSDFLKHVYPKPNPNNVYTINESDGPQIQIEGYTGPPLIPLREPRPGSGYPIARQATYVAGPPDLPGFIYPPHQIFSPPYVNSPVLADQAQPAFQDQEEKLAQLNQGQFAPGSPYGPVYVSPVPPSSVPQPQSPLPQPPANTPPTNYPENQSPGLGYPPSRLPYTSGPYAPPGIQYSAPVAPAPGSYGPPSVLPPPGYVPPVTPGIPAQYGFSQPQPGYPRPPSNGYQQPGFPTGQQGYGGAPPGYIVEAPTILYGGNNGISNCFTYKQNCLIVRAAPFERRAAISAEQCANLCLSITAPTPCQSLVYDTLRQICDLFAIQAGEHYSAAVAVYGFDYYMLKPNCRNITPPPFPVTPATPPPTGPTPVTATPRTPATPTPPGPITTAPPPSASCPAGQAVIMQQAQGNELTGSDGFIMTGISQSACILACINNQNTQGQPYPCLSIDYQTATQTCILTSEAASPTRNGILIINPDNTYFEKTCVATDVASRCPQFLARFPQMQLIGFSQMMLTSTYAECIEACFNSQTRFNFQCRSAMYYYSATVTQDNCILNFEDRTAEPSLFIPADNEQVEYFDLTTCGSTSRRRFDIGSSTARADQEFNSLTPSPVLTITEPSRASFEAWQRYFSNDTTPPRNRDRPKPASQESGQSKMNAASDLFRKMRNNTQRRNWSNQLNVQRQQLVESRSDRVVTRTTTVVTPPSFVNIENFTGSYREFLINFGHLNG